MTGSELLTIVREMVKDKEGLGNASDTLGLWAINDSFNKLCDLRKKQDSNEHVFTMSIANGSAVPDNFNGFTSTVPIHIKDLGVGRTFNFAGTSNITASYYIYRDHLANLSATIPFKSGDLTLLAEYAARFLEMHLGKDVSQDSAAIAERK